jgi:death-on-curing protein
VSEPRFLSVAFVEDLHQRSIARFGGTLGLRDRASLEAAVGQPLNTFYYGRGDLFDIAAAYAFHIAEAQAFLDGNKRTGVAAALSFLEANGIDSKQFSDLRIYEAMIAIAEKRMTKNDLAQLLRDQGHSAAGA